MESSSKGENKTIPSDFEPVINVAQNSEECIFEIYKSDDYDKIVPKILDAIDHYNSKDSNSYSDYPYFKVRNAVQYLPPLDFPSDIFSAPQLKELHSRLPYYHQYSGFIHLI